MGRAYTGFYWTLPVPRRGFRQLPADVEAAARRSRTIRYQLELIRRYVRVEKGHLIAERAFMEFASDRGTEAVREELDKIIPICIAKQATLLVVDFSQAHHWRPHEEIPSYVRARGVECEPLLPEREMIDGQFFDPIRHFRQWHKRHASEGPAMRERAKLELLAVMGRLPEARGRTQRAADDLNQRGITTGTGRRWTAEGVRKTYARLTATDADA